MPLALLAAVALQSTSLAITHVTVVDGTDGRPKRDTTVLIEGGRIKAIGRVRLPEGTREIDGRGKFLIPGLWDMHVHGTGSPHFSALYIANGVTGVRDMFTQMPLIRAERAANTQPDHPGPTISAAGRIFDGRPPFWAGSIVAMDAESGRKGVETALTEGSEFIKVYERLPRDAYFAIIEEAKRRKVPFAGHVPYAILAQEAAESGQRSIEHLSGFLRSVSRDPKDADLSGVERSHAFLNHYDAGKARDLARLYARRGTWQVPTLTVLRAMLAHDPEVPKNPNVRYMSPLYRALWNRPVPSPEKVEADRATWAKYAEVMALLRRERVPMLAGTDVSNPYCLPGFSLHDELDLMVKMGYSPKEALQMATRNPARFLGQESEFGTLRPGLRADMLLLDADPLAAITNTRRIRSVFLNGRELDRRFLDGLLSAAEKGAGTATTLPAGGMLHED